MLSGRLAEAGGVGGSGKELGRPHPNAHSGGLRWTLLKGRHGPGQGSLVWPLVLRVASNEPQ